MKISGQIDRLMSSDNTLIAYDYNCRPVRKEDIRLGAAATANLS